MSSASTQWLASSCLRFGCFVRPILDTKSEVALSIEWRVFVWLYYQESVCITHKNNEPSRAALRQEKGFPFALQLIAGRLVKGTKQQTCIQIPLRLFTPWVSFPICERWVIMVTTLWGVGRLTWNHAFLMLSWAQFLRCSKCSLLWLFEGWYQAQDKPITTDIWIFSAVSTQSLLG